MSVLTRVDEAAAIVLLAKARVGELTIEMVKVPDGQRRGSEFRSGTQKSAALSAEGLSRKEAAECEKGRPRQRPRSKIVRD